MRANCLSALLCVLSLQLLAGEPAPKDAWAQPELPTAALPLPRLGQALTLDGELLEWSSAAVIPLRYAAYIDSVAPNHQWRGPEDAGAEFYCAWTENGLCLGALVTDDEVINTKSGDEVWQQDGIELFVDGRVGEKFRKPPYSPGAYQILIKPPQADQPATAAAYSPHGKLEGLKVAGKRTASGYTIELLVPWAAFPDFKSAAGSEFGLNFGLDDYDARDKDTMQPLMMTPQAVHALSKSPQNLIKWVLADKVKTGSEAWLGPLVGLDMPSLVTSLPCTLAVDVPKALVEKPSFLAVSITNFAGEVVLQSRTKMSSPAGAWKSSRRGALQLEKPWPEGWYVVKATVFGKDEQPAGSAQVAVLLVAGALQDISSRLDKVDLAGLSQASPFKAAAYMGAAAGVERIKRRLETQDAVAIPASIREVLARFSVLEKGALPATTSDLHDLLLLTAIPEAQVVVEYPFSRRPENNPGAAVTFFRGSLPLATVRVQQMKSPEEALKSITGATEWILRDPFERTTIDGCAAAMQTRGFQYARSSEKDFSPEKHVTALRGSNALLVAAEMVSHVNVKRAIMLDDCPAAVRQSVEAWARQANVPVVSLADALGKETSMSGENTLIAGDIRPLLANRQIKASRMYSAVLGDAGCRLSVASGTRLFSAQHACRTVAERAIALVRALKPVTPADVEGLREELLKNLKLPAAAPVPFAANPPDVQLYAGDVHMHTFYSDGTPSPAGLMAQAIYCYLDFAVMTDHNTLDGALVARRLFNDAKFAYPIVVGEEVTTKWAHLNAYPLRELVDPKLSPYEIIRAAHSQGAVVQWNHPDFTGSEWENSMLEAGIAGSGLDAWEHIPLKHDEWRKAGRLPLITGSSDTHDNCFEDSGRTVILAPLPQGEDLAEAVRAGRVAALYASDQRYVCGPDRMLAAVGAALADGRALQSAKAERLKQVFRSAKLSDLLFFSVPKAVKPESLPQK